MSGHQPTLWHAGIAAKWLAIGAAAEAWNAAPAWVVVDHDAVAPLTLDVPTIDGEGTVRRVRMMPEASGDAGRPACDRRAMTTRGVRLPSDVPEGVRVRAERTLELIESHSNATNASEQSTEVMAEYLRGFFPSPTIVRASAILSASPVTGVIVHMAREARVCVEAYNAAAARHRHTRIRPLRIMGDDAELPLWKLEHGAERRPVFASEVQALLDNPRVRLAPRALLLTYLLRRFACDFFVHGTGGGGTSSDPGDDGYDAVMHEWIDGWLGDHAGLAMLGVATATVRLDLPVDDDAERVAWLAHAARHNPALADAAQSAPAQEAKFDRVGQIARSTDRNERARLYYAMHADLAEFRSRHAGILDDLDARARTRHATGASIARSRTWSVLLHDPKAIVELGDRLRSSLTSGTGVESHR